jgi:hypothetical protein
MGDDFSNRMLFAGEEPPALFRQRIIAFTDTFMREQGYLSKEPPYFDETFEGRALTFGPPGRWLFMGDTSGSTECVDTEAWQDLTIALSKQAPVVDAAMSDSCCLHLQLWRGGERQDIIGNGELPFGARTDSARRELCGHPERWRDLLLEHVAFSEFEQRWNMEHSCYELLRVAIDVFGWPPGLSATGYSLDFDGIFSKYEPEDFDLTEDDFTELHWDDSNVVNASAASDSIS